MCPRALCSYRPLFGFLSYDNILDTEAEDYEESGTEFSFRLWDRVRWFSTHDPLIFALASWDNSIRQSGRLHRCQDRATGRFQTTESWATYSATAEDDTDDQAFLITWNAFDSKSSQRPILR